MPDSRPVNFPDYATEATYTIGPDAGNPTKEALLPLEVEQGNGGGEGFASRVANGRSVAASGSGGRIGPLVARVPRSFGFNRPDRDGAGPRCPNS